MRTNLEQTQGSPLSIPFSLKDRDQWLESGAILGLSPESGQILIGIHQLQEPLSASDPRFYAPDFFLETLNPWIYYEKYQILKVSDLLELLDPPNAPLHLRWLAASKERFADTFGSLEREFQAGTLSKAVPYAFEEAPLKNSESALFRHQTLKSILSYAQNQSVYPYGFWNESEMMLGCSPEVLFQKEAGAIRTMALAGTRRKADTDSVSLLKDPKELREHQIVIDSITRDLKPLGRVTVSPTGCLELPLLTHLKTEIELTPHPTVTFENLVSALHPTAALGAFPKAAGLEWLKAFENLQRSLSGHSRLRFGAPFGAVWDRGEKAQVLVSIRNVQWKRECLTLCAGCGVIAESRFEKEWQEIQGKIHAIKKLIGTHEDNDEGAAQ